MLDLPTNRDEAWRWSDLSALPALASAAPRGGVIDVSDHWLGCDGPRLLFVDGVLQGGGGTPAITHGPLALATDHKLGRLTGDADGWTLALGRDEAPAGPIEIVHVATGGANHVPACITLADGAQASIVETYVGQGWSNRLTRIAIAPGARLMRAIRLTQSGGFVSLRDEAEVAAGASLVTTLLAAGGADTRIDGALTVTGDGGYVEQGGALLARGIQRHDVGIVVRHAAQDGQSAQPWKAVADDAAVIGLAARVEVARDAQRTDAKQGLRGLLLRRGATVNLKPELEIFADDVKCAHGATIGELDPQALFYLASRGLPPTQARAILTRAFVADALDRIGEPAARDAFMAAADDWLGAGA